MAAGLAVVEGAGNVVRLVRAPPCAAAARQAAVARLRARLRPDDIVYAVRRAHDSGLGWLVCDLYLIDRDDVACITADLALALDCADPAREIGVKLRRGPTADPLTHAIDLRLSTLLFGVPNRLRHRRLD